MTYAESVINDFCKEETSPFGPPKKSGVYGVFVKPLWNKKERLLYIGSSLNVHDRVMGLQHPYRLLYERFDSEVLVYTKTLETLNYVQAEKILIKHFRPILNKYHKNV